MINSSLSIAPLINVTASIEQAAVQAESTQTMLVLSNSTLIDVVTRMQTFQGLTAVETFYGANAPESAAATDWFSQVPQPLEINFGRWVETASSGQLFGSPISTAAQAIAQWQAITDGGFTISIDGGVAENVVALNFADAANLNGVAAAIQAKLAGATIVWNASSQNFVVTGNSTGVTSSVSFASAPAVGGFIDISGVLGLTAGSSGAYQAPGMAPESALAAAALFDQNFGQRWYGLSILGGADSDHLAVGQFIAGTTNKHFYWVSTQETGVLVPSDTTDIAAALQAGTVKKTAVQFSSTSPYSALSLAGRILTVDYTGTNTAINLMYKQEPGAVGEALNALQLSSLLAKNCNAFLTYNNGATIIQPGICSDGNWIDTVIGANALVLSIQSAVFNLFVTSATKIPQTDAGMHRVKVTIEQVLAQFVANGDIAPGIWNGPLFGALQNGSDGTPPTLTKGYYVYQPPIASQSQAARSQRISVPFQIAANLAGAVQTVNVAVTLQD